MNRALFPPIRPRPPESGGLFRLLLLGCALWAGLAVAPPGLRAQSPESPGQAPEVDWKAGTLSARGQAQPGAEAFDPAQASAMAGREALIQARRRLLDAVRSLPLDANRQVGEALVRDRETESRATAIVQGSRVLESAPGPGGAAQARVGLSIWGDLADALISRSLAFQGGAYAIRAEAREPGQERTGVVVDARGLSASPAILPRVLDERGAEAYGPGFATRACAVAQGLAAVFSDPAEAARSPRVGGSPLVVKALRVQGRLRTDPVVSQADAEAIRALAGKGGPLSECRVALVLDDPGQHPGQHPGPASGEAAPAGSALPGAALPAGPSVPGAPAPVMHPSGILIYPAPASDPPAMVVPPAATPSGDGPRPGPPVPAMRPVPARPAPSSAPGASSGPINPDQ